MDKRYQVFLSSTFADLEEERKEVIAALQKAGYLVSGMETFPSDDDESWEVIKRVIGQSDYYVLVVAGRYGSIGKGGKSFTEMEYEHAKTLGLPVLAFLHRDPNNLPHKNVETSNQDKLEKFRSKIDKLHNRRSWSTKHELSTEVLASLSQTVNLRPQTGWVRGDIADENAILSRKLEEARSECDAIRTERDNLAERLQNFGADESKKLIAWGNDVVELAILVRDKKSSNNHVEMSFTTQWSRVFDLVAPNLIGWCATHKAMKSVESMLEKEVSKQHIEFSPVEFAGLSKASFRIVRNQLVALELIQIETKNQGQEIGSRIIFSNTVEYWRLSNQGLREYSIKHAIRRESD